MNIFKSIKMAALKEGITLSEAANRIDTSRENMTAWAVRNSSSQRMLKIVADSFGYKVSAFIELGED
ncbi:MAG: hypothetical protein V3U78_04490 [Thiotrichaceae bacterium]